jgi:hypothetical protein
VLLEHGGKLLEQLFSVVLHLKLKTRDGTENRISYDILNVMLGKCRRWTVKCVEKVGEEGNDSDVRTTKKEFDLARMPVISTIYLAIEYDYKLPLNK